MSQNKVYSIIFTQPTWLQPLVPDLNKHSKLPNQFLLLGQVEPPSALLGYYSFDAASSKLYLRIFKAGLKISETLISDAWKMIACWSKGSNDSKEMERREER